MDPATNGRVFHYHADANPFGGTVTAPDPLIIETQASSSVSEGGGHASSSALRYSVLNTISVESAFSEIRGLHNEGERVWESEVTSVVQGLNILDIVTAEEIRCKYIVKHPQDDPPYYPSVDFAQCSFTHLCINGAPITPETDLRQFSRTADDVLMRGGCWLEDPVLMGRVFDQNANLVKGAPNWLAARYSWVPNAADRHKKGYAVCSLVLGFKGLKAGMTAYGHVLEVANLGFLFFGELFVHHGSFGVTMLRAEISQAATAPARGGKGLGATVGVAVAHNNTSGSP